ncbi:DUF4097 family beta strand repeat-containing protein [Isobaculum melis]|uniref:Putative adhesin n=1 Tax=Isobaculum melis TaxID=142588 RepID=A0A1H9TQ19_9LACT|nr:DUF4097 family beta strand repeat-containing protein [Isobaculum melis]SER99460.1 Putative adhesin [Isobaculum melis]
MKKKKTSFIVSLAILLIIIGSVGVGLNFTKVRRDIQNYEETYETKNLDTLTLDIGNRGDTTIHYTNSDQIEVFLSGTDLERTPIKTNYSKDKVEMLVTSTPPGFFDQFDFEIDLLFMEFDFSPNVKVDIYLPKSIQNLEIKGTSANLIIDDELSMKQVKVVTNSGNVEISDLSTDKLSVKTTSGNIDLDDIIANKITFEARSGNIILEDLFGTVKGNVTSGNIYLSNNRLDQEIDFEATSGNIELSLDHEPKDATIEAKTSSGYIQLDNMDNVSQKTFGKGSAKIKLRTSSGNISFSVDDDDD